MTHLLRPLKIDYRQIFYYGVATTLIDIRPNLLFYLVYSTLISYLRCLQKAPIYKLNYGPSLFVFIDFLLITKTA